jgi:hypothetical protein
MAEYLLLPFVEIEVRLGTINGKKFDSSVDKKHFEKIKSELMNGSNHWDEIKNTETIEYIKDSVKLIKNQKKESTKVIMKENVLTNTFSLKNSPFDIRFSVNQEFKLDSYLTSISTTDSVVRTKNRVSFISDSFQYDLTVVNEKINNINVLKYEIEIELLVNDSTLTWSSEYILDFIECKIYDLVNIIEPMERESFKIKVL